MDLHNIIITIRTKKEIVNTSVFKKGGRYALFVATSLVPLAPCMQHLPITMYKSCIQDKALGRGYAALNDYNNIIVLCIYSRRRFKYHCNAISLWSDTF